LLFNPFDTGHLTSGRPVNVKYPRKQQFGTSLQHAGE
jgi:hypothetical protein